MAIRDTIFKSFKQGYSESIGHRKDDPALKDVKEFSSDDIRSDFDKAKRESIVRSTGKPDLDQLDKTFERDLKNRSYQAGILRGQRKKYMTPELIYQEARKAYKGL